MSAPEDIARALLAALAANEATIPADNLAIVVAHPDDEAIGIGGSLARLKTPWIVHVTDGGTLDPKFSRQQGFDSPEAYSRARLDEVKAAMRLVGIPPQRLINLGIADQDVPNRMAAVARELKRHFSEKRIEIVVTHAYEGGHYDHDGVAFAVHAAAARLARDAGVGPAIIEMPLYRNGFLHTARQSFSRRAGTPETLIRLSSRSSLLKSRLYEAYRTQRGMLGSFDVVRERFRLAPAYDFERLPNRGNVHYDRFSWAISSRDWPRLVRNALDSLSSDDEA